jgi:hypothetical protein
MVTSWQFCVNRFWSQSRLYNLLRTPKRFAAVIAVMVPVPRLLDRVVRAGHAAAPAASRANAAGLAIVDHRSEKHDVDRLYYGADRRLRVFCFEALRGQRQELSSTYKVHRLRPP